MKPAFTRVFVAAFAFCLISSLAARAEEWTKTYSLTGRPDLRIETSDANIRVTTWDQSTIEAKVDTTRYKIGEGGIRIEERQDGNRVEIEVHYPHHAFTVEWGQHKVDISSRCRGREASTCAPAMAGLKLPALRGRWICTPGMAR